jgi:hypothetical protein
VSEKIFASDGWRLPGVETVQILVHAGPSPQLPDRRGRGISPRDSRPYAPPSPGVTISSTTPTARPAGCVRRWLLIGGRGDRVRGPCRADGSGRYRVAGGQESRSYRRPAPRTATLHHAASRSRLRAGAIGCHGEVERLRRAHADYYQGAVIAAEPTLRRDPVQ